MPNLITLKCKHCGHELILDELLEAQIAEKFNNDKLPELTQREESLQKREAEFEIKRKRENEIVSKEVSKKTNEMQLKLDYLTTEIAEMQQKAKDATQTELELRKANTALLQEKANIELEVVRKVEQDLEKTRREAIEITEKKQALALLDKEKTISDLKTMVDNLNRKLRQGSQQQQGEVGELHVEDILRREFPIDELLPVPKGQSGADILLAVKDNIGRPSGKVLLEVKRTKNWSSNWIEKVKKDQMEARADIAVIISEVLPDMGKKKFGYMDGVWVCDFYVFRELIAVLRYQLLEVNRINLLRNNEQSKASEVYDYVSGTEFRQTVTAIMGNVKMVKDNLDYEKNTMQKIWAKQEKLIEQILYATIKVQANIEVLTGSTQENSSSGTNDVVA